MAYMIYLYSIFRVVKRNIKGYSQVVRHQTLTLAFVGSNPAIPAKKKRQFSTEDCRFFLFFSLLAFHISLFSQIVVSREKIREKREEKR